MSFPSQYGQISPSMQQIVNLAFALREAKDPIMKNLSTTLSTRQLLRIAHRSSVFSSVSIYFDLLSKFNKTRNTHIRFRET